MTGIDRRVAARTIVRTANFRFSKLYLASQITGHSVRHSSVLPHFFCRSLVEEETEPCSEKSSSSKKN